MICSTYVRTQGSCNILLTYVCIIICLTYVRTPGSCNILQRIGHRTRHHIEACKGTEQTPSKHDLESK